MWTDEKRRNVLERSYFPIVSARKLMRHYHMKLDEVVKVEPNVLTRPIGGSDVAAKPKNQLGLHGSSNESQIHMDKTEERAKDLVSNAMKNKSKGEIESRTDRSSIALENYEERVKKAISRKHVFIDFMDYPIMRSEFKYRGWLEKLPPSRSPKFNGLNNKSLVELTFKGYDCEPLILSNLLSQYPAFFVLQRNNAENLFKQVFPIRNRIEIGPNLNFSAKYGLIACKEQEKEHLKTMPFRMNMPRAYRLGGPEENFRDFIEDFRQTQCRALLRLLCEHWKRFSRINDEERGVVQERFIELAFSSARQQVELLYSKNAWSTRVNCDATNNEWLSFEARFNSLMCGKAKFKVPSAKFVTYCKMAKELLDKIHEKRPELRWDGNRNLWILKPSNGECGRGIVIKRTLADITAWVEGHAQDFYLVQKYVETPMLVYNSKFDVRVYALIKMDKSNNISIWLYKNCYFKISGCKFDLQNLDPEIHLTNFTVQKRYAEPADKRLPSNHMWSLQEFKEYLDNSGLPLRTWAEIFTKIGDNVVATVLSSYRSLYFVPNTYELYGVDFMLDKEYTPILLEFNNRPDLSPSTNVTAKICSDLQRDIVRLLVDMNDNPEIGNITNFTEILRIDYQSGRVNDVVRERDLGSFMFQLGIFPAPLQSLNVFNELLKANSFDPSTMKHRKRNYYMRI